MNEHLPDIKIETCPSECCHWLSLRWKGKLIQASSRDRHSIMVELQRLADAADEALRHNKQPVDVTKGPDNAS